jgi:hypothetical protein
LAKSAKISGSLSSGGQWNIDLGSSADGQDGARENIEKKISSELTQIIECPPHASTNYPNKSV